MCKNTIEDGEVAEGVNSRVETLSMCQNMEALVIRCLDARVGMGHGLRTSRSRSGLLITASCISDNLESKRPRSCLMDVSYALAADFVEGLVAGKAVN